MANKRGWFNYIMHPNPVALDRHDLLGINKRMREANDKVQAFKDEAALAKSE